MPDKTDLQRPRDVAGSGLTRTQRPETRDDGRAKDAPTRNEQMAALEATIDKYKQSGVPDGQGNARPWQDFREEEKFDRIMATMRDLRVENEPAAYHVLAREVDMARLPNAPSATAHDPRDGMPTPQEWQKIQAEWTRDAGLRRLEERAVRYEDQPGRPATDNAHRAQFQKHEPDRGLDR